MTGNAIELGGCRPTPLASYLKALGVLRLVSEQQDSNAAGFWRNERFHLRTSLDRAALTRFFLKDYAPTPIIAPWNGRAGFSEGEGDSEVNGDAELDGDDEPKLSTREGAKLRRSYEQTEVARFQSLRNAARAFATLPIMTEMDRVEGRTESTRKANWQAQAHSGRKRRDREAQEDRDSSESGAPLSYP